MSPDLSMSEWELLSRDDWVVINHKAQKQPSDGAKLNLYPTAKDCDRHKPALTLAIKSLQPRPCFALYPSRDRGKHRRGVTRRPS